jgi:hypothetical protein
MPKLLVLILVVSAASLGNIEIAEARTECNDSRKGIVFYRNATWEWQFRLDKGHTPTDRAEVYAKGCAYLRWVAQLWKERSAEHYAAFTVWFKRTYQKWECIHSGEGAWNSDTGNGYYGGLQMDTTFQRRYGLKYMKMWGTANNWPVWAQLKTAERAYHSGRDFYPWPTTSRSCGLI